MLLLPDIVRVVFHDNEVHIMGNRHCSLTLCFPFVRSRYVAIKKREKCFKEGLLEIVESNEMPAHVKARKWPTSAVDQTLLLCLE